MKDKIISIMFIVILFTFMILGIVFKDREVSNYERRRLITTQDLKEDFFANLDDYLNDQFPFRDSMISFNSIYNRYVLFNKEYNDVYIKDGYIIEKNYPLNEKSLSSFIRKINYVNDTYLKNNENVYYSIIPDKSYFLEDDYLKIDFNYVINKLNDGINFNYIDIFSMFGLEDYYKTDIHIRQDSYFKVLDEFNKYLDFNYREIKYKEKVYDDFYGASFSKVSKFFSSEPLVYLVNNDVEIDVNHLEFGKKKMYDIDKLGSVDSYNVFLSGPSALIDIYNKNGYSDKELVVFRDSFGSSLVPLLVPFYKKITLIDLRYINMNVIENYVNFDDKDVLFLYSTLIVNNSGILKIDNK